MFSYCKIATIKFKSFDVKKVTNISQMFFKCKNLTDVDLSCFELNEKTKVNDLFHGCSNLQCIYRGNNPNTQKILDSAVSKESFKNVKLL